MVKVAAEVVTPSAVRAVPTAAQLGRQSRGVVTSDTGDASGDGGAAGGRPRFREVLASAGASSKLLGKWAKAKGAAAMPEPVKKAVVRRMANKIAKQ